MNSPHAQPIPALALGLLAAALAACGGPAAAPTPAASPLPPVSAANTALAEAKVVPARYAALSFDGPGRVTKVLVTEGQQVRAGEPLLRLVSGAEAAAVLAAEANLAAAQAELARLDAGASSEALAAAEAAVDRARAGAQSAAGGVAQARAGAQKAAAGPTGEELAIAERQVEEAKNGRWAVQASRDAICGQADADCDQSDPAAKAACKAGREQAKPGCDQAQANVQAAEEQVRIAELRLAQVRAGARPEDRQAAQGGLTQAQGQYNNAAAAVREAEANLAGLRLGPGAEERAAASARVDAALAALEQARLQLDATVLRAPFAGTVAAVDARQGEQVQPGSPVVQLADLDALVVRTDDLTEVNIVGVDPGDKATLTFDAIPGLSLPGRVQSVRLFGENRQGDVVYTVLVKPDAQDPRLRWNMTASVAIETE